MYKCVLMSRAPWASSNLNAKMNSYLQKLLWHNDMLSRIERRDNYFKCDSFSSAALVFGERVLVSEASERGWLTYWFGKFKGEGVVPSVAGARIFLVYLSIGTLALTPVWITGRGQLGEDVWPCMKSSGSISCKASALVNFPAQCRASVLKAASSMISFIVFKQSQCQSFSLKGPLEVT